MPYSVHGQRVTLSFSFSAVLMVNELCCLSYYFLCLQLFHGILPCMFNFESTDWFDSFIGAICFSLSNYRLLFCCWFPLSVIFLLTIFIFLFYFCQN